MPPDARSSIGANQDRSSSDPASLASAHDAEAGRRERVVARIVLGPVEAEGHGIDREPAGHVAARHGRCYAGDTSAAKIFLAAECVQNRIVPCRAKSCATPAIWPGTSFGPGFCPSSSGTGSLRQILCHSSSP